MALDATQPAGLPAPAQGGGDNPYSGATALIEPMQVYSPEAIEPEFSQYEQMAALASLKDRERRKLAKDVHDALCKKYENEMREFASEVIGHLERERVLCEAKRQSTDFDYRVRRNDRRARNQTLIVFNQDGTVNKRWLDGHAELGIGLGWTEQAIMGASAYFNRVEYESNSRFFVIIGRGKRPENRSGAKILTDIADHFIRKGEFEKEGRRLNYDLPKHGTAFVRYEMTKQHKFARDASGKYGDNPPELVPTFTKWPIEDVLITNPEYPSAADQRGVFWMVRGTDLHQTIDENEAQWDFETGPDGSIGLRRVGGEYQNLEAFRALEDKSYAYQQMNWDASTVTQSNRGNPISPFPTFDLVKFEGELPMFAFARRKKFIPELMACYGFDLGLETPDMNNPDSVSEWGKQLNRIKQWRVSFIRQTSQAGGKDVTNVMISFKPCEYRNPRNCLYMFRYIQDGDNAYGRSVGDVGQVIEDAAVTLVNSAIRSVHFNANPSFVYASKNALEKTLDEINRFLQPNQAIAMDTGLDPNPEKLLKINQLPVSELIPQTVLGLKQEFEFTTLVTSATKTGDDTDSASKTLGELEIKKSTSENKLDDVIVSNAKEKNRMIRDMLEDAYEQLGPTGFANLARQVSGQNASNIDRELPSIEGFWQEYDIDHPLVFGMNKGVIAQEIVLVKQAFPDAFDDNKAAEGVLALLHPHPEEFLNKGYEILDPDEEEYQLASGNWVEPSPLMPVPMQVQHIMAHEDMLRQAMGALQQHTGASPDDDVQLQGQDPTQKITVPAKNLPIFIQQLIQHLQRHKRILQTMAMLGMLQSPQPQGIGGPPQGGPPGLASSTNGPHAMMARQNAISSAANGHQHSTDTGRGKFNGS